MMRGTRWWRWKCLCRQRRAWEMLAGVLEKSVLVAFYMRVCVRVIFYMTIFPCPRPIGDRSCNICLVASNTNISKWSARFPFSPSPQVLYACFARVHAFVSVEIFLRIELSQKRWKKAVGSGYKEDGLWRADSQSTIGVPIYDHFRFGAACRRGQSLK